MLLIIAEFVVLLLATVYVTAWWSAVWLVMGRPRLPISSPIVAVFVLWFGIVSPLHTYWTARAIAALPGHGDLPDAMCLGSYILAGLPVPILTLYAACSLIRQALRLPVGGRP